MCGKWRFVGDWELFAGWITLLTVVFKSTKLDPNESESRIAPNILLEKLPKPPPPPLPEESPYSRRAYPVEEPPIR